MTDTSTAAAPTRVLVTGSVRWRDREMIENALAEWATNSPIEVITGMASGADEIARDWAARTGVAWRAEPLGRGNYPEPMHAYNEQMLEWGPDVVLAFKDDFDAGWASTDCVAGTEHMCRIATEAGVSVVLNGWPIPRSGDARRLPTPPPSVDVVSHGHVERNSRRASSPRTRPQESD